MFSILNLIAMAIRPTSFSHVVYRTYRFEEMLSWYVAVLGGHVQHQSDVIAFVTYDDEHHRVALLNLGVINGPSDAQVPRQQPGVDHVAYGYRTLHDLLEKYKELKAAGIRPYWSIHHGVTVSLYYADPDGNQLEFQTDCFTSNEDANAFMNGPGFGQNPIGVEYDPEQLLARLRDGVPVSDLLPRTEHLPVSPIRGSMLS